MAMLKHHHREGTGTEPIAMSSYVRLISKGSRICGIQGLLMASALLLAAPAPAYAQAPSRQPPRPFASMPASPGASPARRATTKASLLNPSGVTLGLNNRFLTLDGKPWLPVAGEFHFSRYPRDRWEDEILKMKAAGVNVVSTYVIWIHHEEIRGPVRLDGPARPARLR